MKLSTCEGLHFGDFLFGHIFPCSIVAEAAFLIRTVLFPIRAYPRITGMDFHPLHNQKIVEIPPIMKSFVARFISSWHFH